MSDLFPFPKKGPGFGCSPTLLRRWPSRSLLSSTSFPPALFKNTNLTDVVNARKLERDHLRDESQRKKEQDKLQREKDKLAKQERKEKEKKRTQKGERKR
uniref:Uncharacterized protein n=1 Tax=Sphaerodactylus townsendi TaxID=933632 RepID=A0ACB8EC55_9SAUR